MPTRRATRPRPPGRPRAGGADTREHVLDAAVACYARNGMSGTPLRQIAREARVTPALLHYYFADNDGLQRAVIEERVMPAFAVLRDAVQAAGDTPTALVAAFVDGVAIAVHRHAWLPALWVREVLCEDGALRRVLLDRIGPQLPRLLAARFSQDAHTLQPGIDPRLLVVSLVGLTLFPAASASLWRAMFDAPDLDAAAMQAHTLALLQHGAFSRSQAGAT